MRRCGVQPSGDRCGTLVLSQFVLLACSLLPGGLTFAGSVTIWVIYAVALVDGSVSAVSNPTRQAMLGFGLTGSFALALGFLAMSGAMDAVGMVYRHIIRAARPPYTGRLASGARSSASSRPASSRLLSPLSPYR